MSSNLSVILSVDTQLLLVYSRRFQMTRNALLVGHVQIISNERHDVQFHSSSRCSIQFIPIRILVIFFLTLVYYNFCN